MKRFTAEELERLADTLEPMALEIESTEHGAEGADRDMETLVHELVEVLREEAEER